MLQITALNIQSNGGRQVRRGGAGGMGDGSHPFVRTSPFSSSSSSPIITQPGSRQHPSSQQPLSTNAVIPQHGSLQHLPLHHHPSTPPFHQHNSYESPNHTLRLPQTQCSVSLHSQHVSHPPASQYPLSETKYDTKDLHQKTKSLPGYYVRPNPHSTPQTSFREAFANRSPTPTRNSNGVPINPNASVRALHCQDGFNPASFYMNGGTSRDDLGAQDKRHTEILPQNRQPVSPRALPLEQPFNAGSNPAAHSTPHNKPQRPQQPLPTSVENGQMQRKPVRYSTPENYQSKDRNENSIEKKSKRSLLEMFKKRRKNDSKDSPSSGDEQKTKAIPPTQASPTGATISTSSTSRPSSRFTVSRDGHTIVRVAPEKILARNNNSTASLGQPLGIPVLIPAPGELSKKAVSASHDSIMPNLAGQFFSSNNDHPSTLSKRSSSIDNVARKERRQALKTRAESIRTKVRDSSSDEDEKSISSQSMYGSGHSLNRTGSLTRRSKAARTERYLRRKSHELETLRNETEKDKKNKAAVQARILEIQKLQKLESERNRKTDEEKSGQEPHKPPKPRWSADVVYQESNEFDSVVLQTPPATPDSSRRANIATGMPDTSRQNIAQMRHFHSVHIKNTAHSNSNQNGFRSTLGDYNGNMSLNRRLPCDTLSMGDLKNHRSVSYDCDINKPNTPPSSDPGKSRATPPPPPPRERRLIVSPADHRPFSYSFENLHRESPSGSQNQLNKCTTASQGIRAILSQTRQSTVMPLSSPSTSIADSQVLSQIHSVSLPPLPATYHAQSPQAQINREQNFTFASQKVEAPSPQSDVNENDRIGQINVVWRQKINQRDNSRTCPAAYMVNGNIVSDSSRSSTPKADGTAQQAVFNDVLINKMKLKGNSIKAESTSSLSSRSDLASPVSRPTPAKRTQFLTREAKHSEGTSEATNGSRHNMASLEKAKREMQLILEKERNLLQTKAEKQRQFEEAYRREKRKLEKSRCANFEEALHELEELYRSLKLDGDDSLDDSQEFHDDGLASATQNDRGRSRTPSTGRKKDHSNSGKDDMHYRRCLQSAKTSSDALKALQITPSYLLISQAHLSASEPELSQPRGSKHEPDIVHDDASLRSIKRANALKVIDPQPPFGIPIGPTTQASPNNYLHLQPNDLCKSKSLPRAVPDPAMDDLAFRNLRRDQRGKSINASGFDELFSECNDSATRRNMRSQSADRVKVHKPTRGDQNRSQTPRKVKHHNEAKRNGHRDLPFDESSSDVQYLRSNRNTPSWLDRAHLNDPEINADLSSTKAVSQPDIRSAIIREARAPTGGPDEFSMDMLALTCEVPFFSDTSSAHGTSTDLTAPRLVKIQALNHASTNEGLITKTLYRPSDSVFNNKPKPFYLIEKKAEDRKPMTTPALPTVDSTASAASALPVAQLESLISTISNTENDDEVYKPQTKPTTYSRVYAPSYRTRSSSADRSRSSEITSEVANTSLEKKSPANIHLAEKPRSPENTTGINDESQNPLSAYQKYEVKSAKHNIMNAIRLSMAMGSASSEGRCADRSDDNCKASMVKASPKPPARSSSIPPPGHGSRRDSWSSQNAPLDHKEELIENSVKVSSLENCSDLCNENAHLVQSSAADKNDIILGGDIIIKNYTESSKPVESGSSEEAQHLAKNTKNTNDFCNAEILEEVRTITDKSELVYSNEPRYLRSDDETEDESHSEYESMNHQDDDRSEILAQEQTHSGMTIANASKIVLDVAVELSSQIYHGTSTKTNQVDEGIDNPHEASNEAKKNELNKRKDMMLKVTPSPSKIVRAEKSSKKLSFRDIDCSFTKDFQQLQTTRQNCNFASELPTVQSSSAENIVQKSSSMYTGSTAIESALISKNLPHKMDEDFERVEKIRSEPSQRRISGESEFYSTKFAASTTQSGILLNPDIKETAKNKSISCALMKPHSVQSLIKIHAVEFVDPDELDMEIPPDSCSLEQQMNVSEAKSNSAEMLELDGYQHDELQADIGLEKNEVCDTSKGDQLKRQTNHVDVCVKRLIKFHDNETNEECKEVTSGMNPRHEEMAKPLQLESSVTHQHQDTSGNLQHQDASENHRHQDASDNHRHQDASENHRHKDASENHRHQDASDNHQHQDASENSQNQDASENSQNQDASENSQNQDASENHQDYSENHTQLDDVREAPYPPVEPLSRESHTPDLVRPQSSDDVTANDVEQCVQVKNR
ncbi:uncharacterized protein LOC108675738 isoform X2 [Hyalella azteca]|uniref:Uncharacterized protein LOC108675738 isoform X2 n=1 Tax=Hyalella azteca TaxID=294128 RepID=A0A8B7NZJ7_HYAAZ|nr:uncharacterized protein LOC108675738 isoform X2 [Hyalella azteca]